jgi:hypothetical protein
MSDEVPFTHTEGCDCSLCSRRIDADTSPPIVTRSCGCRESVPMTRWNSAVYVFVLDDMAHSPCSRHRKRSLVTESLAMAVIDR